MRNRRRLSDATVKRLPLYLRGFIQASEAGLLTVSSRQVSQMTAVSEDTVRRDMLNLRILGTRGVGYDVQDVIYRLSQALGLTGDINVAIVGVGNLGRALANYRGFASRSFRISALIDSDPSKVGEVVGGVIVQSLSHLEKAIQKKSAAIAIIATPAEEAQLVAERLVTAGVRSILNFAPVMLDLRSDITVRNVDLGNELQILSFYGQVTPEETVVPEQQSQGS
jgi:redox-sensing transcriptional repressor